LFSLQDIIMCLTGVMILLVLFLALETIGRNTIKAAEQIPDSTQLEAKLKELEARQSVLMNDLHSREVAAVTKRIRSPLEAARELQVARRSLEAMSRRLEDLSAELKATEEAMGNLASSSSSKEATVEELAQKLSKAEAEAAKKAFRPIAFIPESGTSKNAHLVGCGSNLVRIVSLAAPRRNTEWKTADAEEAFARMLKSCSASSEYFVFMLKPSGVPLGMRLYFSSKRRGFDAGYDVLEEDAGIAAGGGT